MKKALKKALLTKKGPKKGSGPRERVLPDLERVLPDLERVLPDLERVLFLGPFWRGPPTSLFQIGRLL